MSETARSREQKRRLEERARARARAAAVAVPDEADVAVLGGGASGLAAAIGAARMGAGVVLLEAAEEAGLPILATGNGRCNLANVDLSPLHYNAPEFVSRAMGTHPLEAILEFFDELGLVVEEEEAGRLYPRSRQAASVRNLLVAEALRLGVTVAPLREVVGLDATAGRGDRPLWEVRYLDRSRVTRTGTAAPDAAAERTLRAQAVVLATGGGTGSLVEGLGVPLVKGRPALCGLACEASPLDRLDGRRVQALVRLERDGREFARSPGEVLFREGGLTGPPILDVSRFAEAGDTLYLDLLPDLAHDEIEAGMARHLDSRGHPTPIALDGLIDPVVGRAIVELAGDGWPVPADSIAETAASLAKALPFAVAGRIAAHAQVTQGGIALDAVDPATMALTSGDASQPLAAGLFATGEVLDVDGPCGGYNLSFAWLSGLKAGHVAAKLAQAASKEGPVAMGQRARQSSPTSRPHPGQTERSRLQSKEGSVFLRQRASRGCSVPRSHPGQAGHPEPHTSSSKSPQPSNRETPEQTRQPSDPRGPSTPSERS